MDLTKLKDTGHRVTDVCGAIYVSPYGDPGYSDLGHDLDDIKKELLGLEWVTQRTARHEYFMSLEPRTYTYGNRGTGDATYTSREFSPHVLHLMGSLNRDLGTDLNVCFLNKYDNEQQHLGWHADDFDGMRADQPIVCVSFGAVREIWMKDKRGFSAPCPQCGGSGKYSTEVMARYGDDPVDCSMCAAGPFWQSAPPNGKQPVDQRVKLEEASLFIMPPGYQDTHLHRIPKHDRPCGWRISLTFRSFN